MPEKDFHFTPAPEVKSFQSQVSHITTWLNTHSKNVTGVETKKMKAKTKGELIAALKEFFDFFQKQLEGMEEHELEEPIDIWYGRNSSKKKILQVMDNHLSHHRGQMVVYLRLKGVKPPSYIGW